MRDRMSYLPNPNGKLVPQDRSLMDEGCGSHCTFRNSGLVDCCGPEDVFHLYEDHATQTSWEGFREYLHNKPVLCLSILFINWKIF